MSKIIIIILNVFQKIFQKFFGLFGRREKAQREGSSSSILNTLVESSGRFAFPPMSDVDHSINVKVIDVKNIPLRTISIVISNETKVKNIIHQIHPDSDNQWKLYEEKGRKFEILFEFFLDFRPFLLASFELFDDPCFLIKILSGSTFG